LIASAAVLTPLLNAQAGSGSPAASPVSALNVNETRPAPPPPPKPAALTPEKRGDIFMARKMYRDAIELYKQGISTNAVLSNKIGIAYHQLGQLDLARKSYEKAIKFDPKYPEAINNLGTVFYAARKYGKAVKQYNKALKLSPNSASIYSNLGTAHFARKKYKRAMEAYDKALSIDPEVFEHRGSHGVLLQERSVEERAKFHFFLAKTYAKAGMVDRVLLYMRKALEEGFKEKNRFVEDPEFAQLQENPEFQQLLAMEVRVL
ncbi:MAG: tetratricopeptide repeat protein, partial [Bryobacteraceae bacterium]